MDKWGREAHLNMVGAREASRRGSVGQPLPCCTRGLGELLCRGPVRPPKAG